ncbi:hypothetical protein [Sphingomonas sp. Leaf412]|uniref:hypothetical protein n=1 Tax=Sphingomonas sp. Leaf412 TaxID=1736370 RepID=UPI001F2D628D|nr:hypothetical protein [Sphingomonas sp. Leaf412]
MNQSNETLWSSLFALAFGVCVLGFLVMIDRQEWFHIRPVSGTAVAMAEAAKAE